MKTGNKFSARTQNGGIAVIEGLSLNTIYTLTETVAPSNFDLNEGVYKFKLARNSNNEIIIETIENSLVSGNANIIESNEVLTPILNVNIQNELRYSLNLNKQDMRRKCC